MRRILTLAAALVALAAFTAPPASADTFFGGLRLVGPASGAVSADDTTVARIRLAQGRLARGRSDALHRA